MWWKIRTCTRKHINPFSSWNFTQTFNQSASAILLFPKWVKIFLYFPRAASAFPFTGIQWFSPCIKVRCCSSFPDAPSYTNLRCSIPSWSHASCDNWFCLSTIQRCCINCFPVWVPCCAGFSMSSLWPDEPSTPSHKVHNRPLCPWVMRTIKVHTASLTAHVDLHK